MKNRIITISREFGSGGRTVGKLVAEKLGIPCYDAELISKIAQESGFSENYIKDASEYASGGQASGEPRPRAEMDGYYNVFVNVETGAVESFEYNSALGGIG